MAIPVIIADLALAAVFTLISLPIIWIKHKKTVAESNALKKALTDERENTAVYNEKFIADYKKTYPDIAYTVNDKNLFDYSTDQHKIFKIRFTKIDDMVFKVVHILLKESPLQGTKPEYSFLLFRDNEEGRAAFDAFIKLNICNYDEFVTDHPVIENSASVTTQKIINRISPITHTYTALELDASGIDPQENPFNYLPLELHKEILKEASKSDTPIDSTKIHNFIEEMTKKHTKTKPEQHVEETSNAPESLKDNNEAASQTVTSKM